MFINMKIKVNSTPAMLSVEIFHSHFLICRLVGLLLKRVGKLGISKELVKLYISIHKVGEKLLLDRYHGS